jgi:hypothetical protein
MRSEVCTITAETGRGSEIFGISEMIIALNFCEPNFQEIVFRSKSQMITGFGAIRMFSNRIPTKNFCSMTWDEWIRKVVIRYGSIVHPESLFVPERHPMELGRN